MLLAPRYIPKLTAIVGLFTRYGLRDFAQRQGMTLLAPDEVEAGDNGAEPDISKKAAAFRRRLVELGPAYVKLGQVLSTRPDLLPPPFIEELEHLQDDVGPIPSEDVRRTIEEELGARMSKLFERFDEEPLGTASLGQVHAAELRGGRAVVVKVQRPGIRPVLAEDIEFFRELATFLTHHTKAGQRVDMLGVVQQLERALSDELDYRVEARNAMTFRRALAEFPRLLIPRVIEAYTTERVLTMERIRGLKIDEIPPVTRLEHDLRPLADEFAKAYLKQITIDGHFHADPHPGNIFVVFPELQNPMTPGEIAASDRRTERRPAVSALGRIEQEAQRDAAPPPDEERVRLALIDFGMTARLPDALRESVVTLLLDLADNRGDAVAETMIQLGEALPEFDHDPYTREVAALIARNYDLAVGEVHAGTVLYEAINISYEHGLRLPAELTLLAKALFNLDAVSRALDPTASPIGAIREYGNRIIDERAKRELSPRRLFQIASATSDLLGQLPRRLDVITQRLAANDFGLKMDPPQLDTLLKAFQKIANRIFSGLVLTGLLIASAMLLPYQRSLGLTGFLIAALLGVYMVVSILVSDHRRRGG
jgi:predicted unusual protein kinase regulating ubiquinone biosynthesis (AarF/ABC1/UbiB family)